ncbi:MAG TPA: glycosyltransferase family 9 protein [Bryobacteraceae bacterium]|nr:glycosyltransferase family 9 protein [Bryobacteraceae bacterium]
MGDILHTLPAVASLRHSFPNSRITWTLEPQWAALLADNPFVDRVVLVDRRSPGGLWRSARSLRAEEYDIAIDFQGLMKSALAATVARADQIFGFHESQVRERAAALFYSSKTVSRSTHVVDRNLDLAAAAGACNVLRVFPIPAGVPEGELPEGDFVLACPLAGWRSKQWPIEFYGMLADRLRRESGIPLVLNGPPGASFPQAASARAHASGLPGLIHATRCAVAVVGVDSGPLHLAAALGKPGAAIFGPTDPSRNGPYGDSLRVLRAPAASTSYKRGKIVDESMRQITPDAVFEVLRPVLNERRRRAGCLV